jgi:hypothetical protein
MDVMKKIKQQQAAAIAEAKAQAAAKTKAQAAAKTKAQAAAKAKAKTQAAAKAKATPSSKTDDKKGDNTKMCSPLDSGLGRWLQSFIYGLVIGLLFLFYGLSYITNTNDVYRGSDGDFTLTDGCSSDSPNLQRNVFTFKHTKYLNPETWSFWDYCLTQHKWYICNFDESKMTSGDNFVRSCQKLFPCVSGNSGSSSMSDQEMITKLFRWPYLYQIVYSSFKNCFHSSMSSGPNYFLFSKPLVQSSSRGDISAIANNAMFFLQIFILGIVGTFWMLYAILYCFITPFSKVTYAWVDFASAGRRFGYLTIIFMYMFFAFAGISTAFITSALLVFLLFYHVHIHFIIRLSQDKTLLGKISGNAKQLLIAYMYWVSFYAIYSATFYGPGRMFKYAVMLAVGLLFYKFRDDLLPEL